MAALKKSVNTKEYDRAAVIEKFEKIKNALVKKNPNLDFDGELTNKALAKVTQGLIGFMEENLGKDAPQQVMVKIPDKFFRDYSPSGSLYTILEVAYKYKNEKEWRQFNFKTPTRVNDTVEMMSRISSALEEHNFWRKPAVFFSGLPESEVSALRPNCINLGARVVDSENGATHIVSPDTEAQEAHDGDDFYRPVEQEDGRFRVHVWYYPDSYDNWYDDGELDLPDIEDEVKPPVWRVHKRWITDSVKYNEWMNEEDYEVEAAATENSPSKRKSKSKTKESKDSKSKKRKREESEEEEVEAPKQPDRKKKKEEKEESDAEAANARKKKLETPAKDLVTPAKSNSVVKGKPTPAATPVTPANEGGRARRDTSVTKMEVEPTGPPAKPTVTKVNPMEDQQMRTIRRRGDQAPEVIRNVSATPTVVGHPPTPSNPVVRQPTVTAGGAGIGMAQGVPPIDTSKLVAPLFPRAPVHTLNQASYPVVVPTHAAWFDMRSISEIEQRTLSEFFQRKGAMSKTAEMYKEYRDFMINTWRQNPREYLTVTTCRKHLTGDVGSILRVHAFLESWGLINYLVDPETRPLAFGPPTTGDVPVIADSMDGIFPVETKPEEPLLNAVRRMMDFGDHYRSHRNQKAPPVRLTSNLGLRQEVFKGKGPHQQVTCHSCAKVCTSQHFQNIHHQDYKICVACHNERRFLHEYTDVEFTKVDAEALAAIPAVAAEWTEDETLLLLQGIEKYGDSSWDDVARQVGSKTKAECVGRFMRLPIEDTFLEPTSDASAEPLPFTTTPNPILYTVSFLASQIHPSVGAAAAKAALAEILLDANEPVTSTTTEKNQRLLEEEERAAAARRAANKKKKGSGKKGRKGRKRPSAKKEDGAADEVEPMETDAGAGAGTAAPKEEGDDGSDGSDEEEEGAAGEAAGGDTVMEDARPASAAPEAAAAEAAPVAAAETAAPAAPAPAPEDEGLSDMLFLDPTAAKNTRADVLTSHNFSADEIDQVTTRTAVTAAISAAAVKAKLLAEREEREIQRLTSHVVELQLRKMEAKLKHLETFEAILTKEREDIEMNRQKLYAERLTLSAQQIGVPLLKLAVVPVPQAPSKSHAAASHAAVKEASSVATGAAINGNAATPAAGSPAAPATPSEPTPMETQ